MLRYGRIEPGSGYADIYILPGFRIPYRRGLTDKLSPPSLHSPDAGCWILRKRHNFKGLRVMLWQPITVSIAMATAC